MKIPDKEPANRLTIQMEHRPGLLPILVTFFYPEKEMESNPEEMFGCLVVLYGFVVPASIHVPATMKKKACHLGCRSVESQNTSDTSH